MRNPRTAAPRTFLVMFLAFALLAAAPSALAQMDPQVRADGAECFERLEGTNATCSVLYAHLGDLLRPGLLSVQELPEGALDVAAGFTGAPGVEPLWSFARSDLGVAGAGAFWRDDGVPQGVPTGPMDTVRLVPDEPVIGHWFLSTDTLEFAPLGMGAGSGGVGVMPCITVEMLLVDTRFGLEGNIIAHGNTTRTVLSSDGVDLPPLPAEDPCPESEGTLVADEAHEFRVVMQRMPGSSDALDMLRVHVLWYQFDPSGDPWTEDKVVQREWNVRSGPEFRPRIVLPVEEPVRVVESFLAEANGTVGISARFASPWGAYEFIADVMHSTWDNPSTDAAPTGLRFVVHDADGVPVALSTVEGPHLRYYAGHGAYDNRLNVTYLWRPGDEGLAPGTYTLVIEADNLQRTATARAVMEYVHGVEAQESPTVAPLIVALLAGLALLARRNHTARP